MEPFNGIVHNGGIPNGPRIHLPLEQLAARVVIFDVGSKVSLTQRYSNPSEHPTSRALYCFPVPARAAICSFELRTSAGRVIRGTCKEKTQAREEHEQAVARGDFTGLLEWVSDDTFTISVGSIAAKEIVHVTIAFVMNLMNDRDRDYIRFHLPMAVGERYGDVPEGLQNATAPGAQTRIRLKVDVQTSGAIQTVTSPTHAIQIEKYSTNLGRPSRRRVTVTFRSNTFLADDFVLLVQAEKLDAPRCFAQLYRDPKKRHNDTLAVQLTVVPKFNMPPIREQEYIFVVDRSGSMNGDKIETAKRTLILLLRMLPQHSFVNIFSFGHHTDSIWPRSVPYDQSYLDIATERVQTMSADYGGTDIYLALDRVHRQRDRTLPTAVFMLTDGEATNVDVVVGLVRKAVNESTPSAPIRVYTLGIGSQVSTAMCEGIADAGNGAFLHATRAEDITAKCARLLRAGRTPFVRNVKVDWGVPEDVMVPPPTSDSLLNDSRYISPSIQQAPAFVRDLHADVRIVIYAIFRLKKAFSPREVTLRGEIDETGQPFQLTVPIRGVQLAEVDPLFPPIHTLAAFHLIREHEAGHAPLPISLSLLPGDVRKQAMVYLGTRYQLVSRHTSFVAVEKSSRADSKEDNLRMGGFLATLFGALTRSTSGSRRMPPVMPRDESVNPADSIPGGWPGSPQVRTRTLRRESRAGLAGNRDGEAGGESEDTADTYSTMSSLEGSSSGESYWTEAENAEDDTSEEDATMQRSPSPQYWAAPYDFNRPSHLDRPGTLHVVDTVHLLPQVSELLSLQKADGSFPLNNALEGIVGDRAVEEGILAGVDRHVWATVLCVAFVQKHLVGQNELRADLLMKAFEFLQGNVEVNALLERAMRVIL